MSKYEICSGAGKCDYDGSDCNKENNCGEYDPVVKHYLYISGPISNDPDYYQKFWDCEKYIRQFTNYAPINPAIVNGTYLISQGILNPSYMDSMRSSFYHLLQYPNTAIVFLPRYHESIGSMWELDFIKSFKYKKMYFDSSVPVINGIPKEMLK